MKNHSRSSWFGVLAVVFSVSVLAAPVRADEKRHNFFAMIGGATSTEDGSDTAFALGGDYEYRFSSIVGIGGLVEYTTNSIDREWLLLAPLTLHPFGGLSFVTGPGVEFTGDESNFVFRLGIGYEIPMGRLSLKPEFNADFVDGEMTYVYGIGIGFGF